MNKILKQNPIFDHIAEARKNFPDPLDQERINEWERRVRNALIVLSLDDNDGIKMLLAGAKEQVISINHELLNTKPIAGDDAAFVSTMATLHARRDVFMWLLSFFADAKQALKEVEIDILEGMGELYPQGEKTSD